MRLNAPNWARTATTRGPKRECRAFIGQLKRHYCAAHNGAELPCELSVKSNRHDFGVYFDVVAVHTEGNAAARQATYWLESNLPNDWDNQAAEEIGLLEQQQPAAP